MSRGSKLIHDRTQHSVVNGTTKRGYRTDLHKSAIARASAIRNSQRPKKDAPAPKLRGAKAKAAAEA
jgi:large subunit ribosomal protein L28e